MSTSLKRIELERNEFIRKLSQEQFDGVITSKYKKLFSSYFNGVISDSELASKNESYKGLISIYENGADGRIDSNQYLYSAIVDVAIDIHNNINKLNLLASLFQLITSFKAKLEHLEDSIYDVFFINDNFKDCNEYLEKKLDCVAILTRSLDALLDEIQKHEDVISEAESSSNTNFLDGVDDNIEKMHLMHIGSLKSTKDAFIRLKDDCVNDTGVKLDILHGEFINE